MTESENPYAAPAATEYVPDDSLGQNIEPAGQGARLLNLIIDQVAQYAIAFVIGFTLMAIGAEAIISSIPDIVFGLTIHFVYYTLLEATTAKTLGKFVTGTTVVSEDGGKPTTKQIIGRTLCRIIPFEVFSFLGSRPRGWHDKIPKTFVVKSR
ncbi:MAG: RDD family protein [Planctomycetales bacterium]|nr:RDD family protein [Planctomycetales bacterium]